MLTALTVLAVIVAVAEGRFGVSLAMPGDVLMLSVWRQGARQVLQARLDEAEELFRRVLATHERSVGPQHSDTAFALTALAEVLANLRLKRLGVLRDGGHGHGGAGE